MSDETRKAVCPQFQSALVVWYDVQGYCVPRRPADRPAIPDNVHFENHCTTTRFDECPWFTGVRHFAGDAPLGATRAEAS